MSSKNWLTFCKSLKKNNEIKLVHSKKNPIDLYRFMYLLNKNSKKVQFLLMMRVQIIM